jgi:ElaB/YqjD/DUF883 family membrane-anchored ribosome-binding protein
MNQDLTGQLLNELQQLTEEATELMSHAGECATNLSDAARAQLHERVTAVKDKMAEKAAQVRRGAAAASKSTNDYLHANPWSGVATAAGVGLLLGLLISRR